MKISDMEKRLASAGIEDAHTEAQALVRDVLGLSSAELAMMKNTDFESGILSSAVEKRCGRIPLQYITGRQYFMNEEYEVSPDCLIPRSDTEMLCEYAIKNLPRGAHFADLCTGSGCIAISVLRARPDCRATAVDISEGALRVARRNALKNGVSDRIDFLCADITKGIDGEFDMILSNPPYIQSEVVKTLSPEVLREPENALDGGADGLDFVRALIEIYPPKIKKGGALVIEFGYDEGEKVDLLASAYTHRIERDLGGRDRMLVIEIK